LSLSGCFVEDIAKPAMGERVNVTLRVPGGQPIELAGRVPYVSHPLGFAVVFDVDERAGSELAAAIRRLSLSRR